MSEERQPSPGLRRLLETKLDTYEKLELVVFVARNGSYTITDLARELQVGTDVLKRLIVDLTRSGMIAVGEDEVVRLTPSDGELPIVKEATQLYESDRHKVITLLSSIALDRIRGMAARTFADAFTLRKKKDDSDG